VTAGVAAGSYQGPPELTLARAFTSWTLDLPALIVMLAAALLYLAGMRRARRSGSWPAARAALFLAGGLGLATIAIMGFPCVYYGVLFYARAVQTILLLLAVPLFLALGRPLTLLAASAPRTGERLQAALGSRSARVITFPAVTAFVLIVIPFLLYFTAWYEAGFHSSLVRQLTYLALLAPGWVFFWTLLRVDPVPKAFSYLVVLWVTGVEVVGDAILGLAIIADQHLIAGDYYRAVGRPWGPSLRTDQVLGGGVLWLLGDLIGLPFLAAALIAMIREDESEAKVIDAELDAREAARAQAGPEPAEADRPWWESDPRFASRFRPPGQ
jgi:cytochrome c oxidase assembly factor CtaG